jgi:hypothetical protein
MVIRAGVGAEAVYFAPEDSGTFASASASDCLATLLVHFERVASVHKHHPPLVEHMQAHRQHVARGRADAVLIVLHQEHNRQSLLNGEADRLIELALPCGGVANIAQHHSVATRHFEPPRSPYCRQALRACGCGETKHIQRPRGVVRGHVAPFGAGTSAREKIERHLAWVHPACQHDSAVAIGGED